MAEPTAEHSLKQRSERWRWPEVRPPISSLLGLVGVTAISGCQTAIDAGSALPKDNSAAVSVLQSVNSGAQSCWMASKDRDFRKFRVIPELDTTVGNPRILIVEASAAQGLPQLVIEASGNPARLSIYGPLTSGKLSERINRDVNRWSEGETACS